MGNYGSSTYTKPDPDCPKCNGRGTEVEVHQVPHSPKLVQILKRRCPCADIKRPPCYGTETGDES